LCINNPDRNRGNRIEAGTINRIESSMTGKRGTLLKKDLASKYAGDFAGRNHVD
jgi:hypothetical protein